MTDEEIAKLKATKNAEEWNKVCDEVKNAHGGYPADLYAKVVLSGLMKAQATSWGTPERAEISISAVTLR